MLKQPVPHAGAYGPFAVWDDGRGCFAVPGFGIGQGLAHTPLEREDEGIDEAYVIRFALVISVTKMAVKEPT
jgi:hypothetical protein